VLSIKRFLLDGQRPSDGQRQVSEPGTRALLLVLQAVAKHSVEYGAAAKSEFAASIGAITQRIEQSPSSEDALISTGEAIHSIQTYNEQATRHISGQARELYGMVNMLTDTVIKLGGTATSSCRNLTQIERSLEQATAIDHIRLLKMRMSDELRSMRLEIESQKARYEELEQGLRENARKTGRMARGGQIDPITDLEDRNAALAAIEQILSFGSGFHVAVFCLENLDQMNKRFGFATGDGVLATFSGFLGMHTSNDLLFRWRGPFFVSIIAREVSSEDVRSELQKMTNNRVDYMVQAGSKSVAMPLGWSWTVISVQGSDSPGSAVDAIDRFVARRSDPAA
jgi:GGDEF domain-containing protein